MRFIFSVILIVIVSGLLYPMASKIENLPMKTYSVINIPDGEFIRYGNYSNGEKVSDEYYITKKTSGPGGEVLYRIFAEFIEVKSGKKLSFDYKGWPTVWLIDPVRGTVLEAVTYLSTNSEDLKNNTLGLNGVFYTRYELDIKTGKSVYLTKSIKENSVIESKYVVNIKSGFPIWEGGAFFMFMPRFMDSQSGGVLYAVAPFMFRDPIPVSLRFVSKEQIRTKAGIFNVKNTCFIFADPFIGKLMEQFTKEGYYYIEDSDRKLPVKIRRSSGSETLLEEISNVNIK